MKMSDEKLKEIIEVLVEKGIITQEEWDRKRMKCTAIADQLIAAEEANR